MRGLVAAVAVALVAFPSPAAAQSAPQAVFHARGYVNGGFFGNGIALEGDVLVVSERQGGEGRGLVSVFERTPEGAWPSEPAATLRASDGSGGDQFGSAIALHDDVIAVGAYARGGGRGAVYVFVRPAGGWRGALTETARLTLAGAPAELSLGYGVDVGPGTIAATTAPGARDLSQGGAVHTYERPFGGWVSTDRPTATYRVPGATPQDRVGFIARLAGRELVTSGWSQDTPAYVFGVPERGPAEVTLVARLTDDRTTGGPGLRDARVATDGVTIAQTSAGALENVVRVFRRPCTGWGDASRPEAVLRSPAATDAYGIALDVDGGRVAVADAARAAGDDGQSGAVDLFDAEGGAWRDALAPTSSVFHPGETVFFDRFGESLAVDGHRFAVGAPHRHGGTGSATLFEVPDPQPRAPACTGPPARRVPPGVAGTGELRLSGGGVTFAGVVPQGTPQTFDGDAEPLRLASSGLAQLSVQSTPFRSGGLEAARLSVGDVAAPPQVLRRLPLAIVSSARGTRSVTPRWRLSLPANAPVEEGEPRTDVTYTLSSGP